MPSISDLARGVCSVIPHVSQFPAKSGAHGGESCAGLNAGLRQRPPESSCTYRARERERERQDNG